MLEPRPVAPGLFTTEADGPRLLAGRCAACAATHFPAAATCPYCGREGADTTTIGPTGRLALFTVVSTRPPGYRGPLPYGFGVVELDDTGLRVVTRLTETRLERLRPGLPMRLVLDELGEDDEGRPVLTYAFAPAEDA